MSAANLSITSSAIDDMPNMTTPPRFHHLTVSDLRRETADAVSLAFAVPPEVAAAYSFAPGQYLTLRATLDGAEVRRSYSICSAPASGELRIAVKLIEDGLLSSFLNSSTKIGDELDVMTPTGRFGQGALQDGRTYAGFAAGSGITPLMSIITHSLEQEPASRFFLFYGNRAAHSVLFGEALADLKDRFPDRLAVLHVLSREAQDLDDLNGHIDGPKIARWLHHIVPAHLIDQAFICGPEAMIIAAEAALVQAGVAADKIHNERFVSSLGGAPRLRAKPAEAAPAAFVATIIADGKSRDIGLAAGETILDGALRAGMDLPFACKGGMCSTCRAALIEGAATMDQNFSLQDWEVQKGFILTCQAHPTTPHVKVDFDAM